MTEFRRILAPIRYPLTAESTQTLAYADQLGSETDDAPGYLFVLHVDLFQETTDIQRTEIRQAVAPLLSDTSYAIIVRRGFLVEEIILEEAEQLNVDVIVIGESQRPWWRRVLHRVLGTGPEVASFLQEETSPYIDVNVAE